MYRRYLKRVFDLIVGSILLILLSPIILLIYLLLLIANKGTAFYIHERPGYKAASFKLIKFKTMSDDQDDAGNLLPDKERITKIGHFLRKTSLDELPQLINVIKGEMSLVGPRPLLFRYLPLYSITQKRRHEVRPGITGWAQVNGRNAISWQEKFALDVYYVDNMSFALDMKILWMTLLKVIKREGINQSSERPMQPFTGNKGS